MDLLPLGFLAPILCQCLPLCNTERHALSGGAIHCKQVKLYFQSSIYISKKLILEGGKRTRQKLKLQPKTILSGYKYSSTFPTLTS